MGIFLQHCIHSGRFFEKAAFYGGTCLRIFYDLQRFSEDMDFSLLEKDENFTLEEYLDAIMNEFNAHGRDVVITRKTKAINTNIESAFLKYQASSGCNPYHFPLKNRYKGPRI